MSNIGLFLLIAFISSYSDPVVTGVDLGIGFDKKTDRPNIFIAWRNTERILEVEVEVKNYGDQQGSGRMVVYILDEEGKILDSSPGPADKPILVTLPPSTRGGKEGKIIQMHGSKSLNLLIDRLDRSNTRYVLKTEIITDQNDKNPLNNSGVKSFNIDSRARPNAVHFQDYCFRNTTDKPINLRCKIDTSPLPSGWELNVEPKNDQILTVKPGEVLQGYAIIKTSKELNQGEHVDLRFMMIEKEIGTIFGQFEWFLVYDMSPPKISGLSYSVDNETGLVEVTLTANDVISMIKEASGVRVEYSTDGGVTYSNKILAYVDGNFVGPTRFRTDLGPFAPGTQLAMSVIVEDAAGNKSQRSFESIVVGGSSKGGGL